MTEQFPPQFGQMKVSPEDWERLLDQYFFPSTPFTLTEEREEDAMGFIWQIFIDERSQKRYKFLNDVRIAHILIEPLDS